jgi:hypothetical protein
MKRIALIIAFATLTSTAYARQPKTYQVTGKVLEVAEDVFVVEKGKEKWEIARTPETKIKGELKVGAKVTVEYRMIAATVEVK